MAARKPRQPKFAMSDEHRLKIQNSNILKVLIEHALGKREMSATQVTTGIALMKKVMPDLAAIDHTTDGDKIEAPTQIILKAAVVDDSND